jgi:hypothetical protein
MKTEALLGCFGVRTRLPLSEGLGDTLTATRERMTLHRREKRKARRIFGALFYVRSFGFSDEGEQQLRHTEDHCPGRGARRDESKDPIAARLFFERDRSRGVSGDVVGKAFGRGLHERGQ